MNKLTLLLLTCAIGISSGYSASEDFSWVGFNHRILLKHNKTNEVYISPTERLLDGNGNPYKIPGDAVRLMERFKTEDMAKATAAPMPSPASVTSVASDSPVSSSVLASHSSASAPVAASHSSAPVAASHSSAPSGAFDWSAYAEDSATAAPKASSTYDAFDFSNMDFSAPAPITSTPPASVAAGRVMEEDARMASPPPMDRAHRYSINDFPQAIPAIENDIAKLRVLAKALQRADEKVQDAQNTLDLSQSTSMGILDVAIGKRSSELQRRLAAATERLKRLEEEKRATAQVVQEVADFIEKEKQEAEAQLKRK